MIFSDFVLRLIFCFFSGLLFIAAMKHSAISNPKPVQSKNRLKWIGYAFLGIGVMQLILFIYYSTRIQFPKESIEFIIPLDGIVRKASKHIVWGYAVGSQKLALDFFIGIFSSLAFTLYFLNFKWSPTKWWTKIFKFIGYIIVWSFYVNSTDFHYFDTSEWVKAGIYIFLIWICFAPSTKPKEEKLKEAKPVDPPIINPSKPGESKTMEPTEVAEPISIVPLEDVTEPTTPEPTAGNEIPVLPEVVIPVKSAEENVPDGFQYCRYCGHKIEADSKFCKYCGKSTGSVNGKPIVKTIVAKANDFWKSIKGFCQTHKPSIKLAKSEYSQPKAFAILKYVAPICLILGLIGIALYIIYNCRNWNYDTFRCFDFYDLNGCFIGFSIGIVVFGALTLLFVRWHKHSKVRIIRYVTWFFAILTYIGCLGNIVTGIVTSFKAPKYYHSIQWDNAIVDVNSSLYDRSVEELIKSRGSAYSYYSTDNYIKYLRQAAEHGNVEAQHHLGLYYFYDKYDNSTEGPDYERSFYWFKKASDNGNLNSKLNVALFYMGKFPGGFENRELAEKYLVELVNSKDELNRPTEAFYYLGLVYAIPDYNKARSIWEKGASLGDEDCKRCIETFSIPEEAMDYTVEAVEEIADTVVEIAPGEDSTYY